MKRHFSRVALVLLGLFFASGVAFSEPPKDALLDHLAGQWVLQGTIDSRQTTHDIDAQWVLQNEYIRFTEVSREKDGVGKPLYEAIVLVGHDLKKARYVCFWYDNTGIASPGSGGTAKREGDTLPFIFKSEQGDFHTTFAYDAKTDTWAWRMDAEANGKLEPFARVNLKRRQRY